MNKDKINNKLIIKRRKKRQIKRILIFAVLLAAVLVILALKLPYFNLNSIEVSGNKVISSEAIVKYSGIYNGNNIFSINIKKARENILKNPYILNVSIARGFPNKVTINVKERSAHFFIKSGSSYIIFDNNGVILEKRDNIKDLKLTEIIGVKASGEEIGKSVFEASSDKEKIEILGAFSGLIERNISKFNISSIDISDVLNLKVYYGNMCVKLGTKENLESKLNKALNILTLNQLKNAKGYIDVSYDGNPVFSVEK